MLAFPPCFFFCFPGLAPPDLFSVAAFLRLPVGSCLPKGRATHSPRDVVIPGLILFFGTEVASRLRSAGTRNVPRFAAPPAALAAVWPPAVSRHVAKAKAAVTPFRLRLPADSAGDPPDLDVGPLEQLQRPCFLEKHIGLPVSSIGCLVTVSDRKLKSERST